MLYFSTKDLKKSKMQTDTLDLTKNVFYSSAITKLFWLKDLNMTI